MQRPIENFHKIFIVDDLKIQLYLFLCTELLKNQKQFLSMY